MFLLERILNEQLFLLIIIAISTILISYCVKNRPLLLKSIALAHLKKTEFKFVSNNTQDQIVTILFWTSVALQTTSVFLFLDEKNNFNVFVIALFFALIIAKRATIFISEIIFQTKTLLETYYTSFVVMVIHLGWLTAPILLVKTTYLSFISTDQTYVINLGLSILILTYLFYRFILLLLEAFKENISFLHIIFYLCTLEILPVVLILNFLIS